MNIFSFIRAIAISTTGAFLLLIPGIVQAQSTCTPTVSVTPVKCFGGNDGALTVTTTTCSTEEGCFTGTPPNIPQCGTGCTRTVTGGQVTIGAGEVVCLQNNFNGDLAFNGGEVRICGTVTIGSINFATSNNNSTLSISPSAIVTVGNISINNPKAVVNNYGKLTISNNYPVVGIFRNYGTATIKGLNTNGNPSIAELHNFATLTVNGNAVNGKVFENRGTMTINGDFNVNVPVSNNVNKCTINVNGNMLLDNSNTLDDRGNITVTGTFTMNNNVTLLLMGNAKVITKNFTGNAGCTIKSTSVECGLISTSGTTLFNGNFTVNGKISYCDKNSIETDNGAKFINGATKDINGACKCTPPSNPPGSAPIYTWSGGGVSGSGATLSNLAAGTYTLTVTCGSCTSSTNWIVPQPAAVTATAVVNSDKSVTLTASGGTPFPSPQPPYKFAWKHQGSDVVISTEQNPKNLPGGINTVFITDQNNCPGTTTVTIPLAACAPNIIVSPITCFGVNNGKISIVDAGCSDPQINWVGLGSSASEISGLRPGNYTLDITCAACTYHHVFTLTEPPMLTASATSDSVGQVTLVVSGGTPFPAPEPSYQYQWVYVNDPTTPKKVISTDPNPMNLPPGLNMVTVTDANGCTTTAQVEIPDNLDQCNPPTTVIHVTCFGNNDGSIVIQRPTCPSAMIVWNDMPEKINQWTLKKLPAGVYSAHISCEGCFYDVSIEITSPALLSIDADTKPDGSGSSTVVGGTGPYFYQWMLEGGSIESRDANPTKLPPGNYAVTVTDFNGCQDTDIVNVPDPDCIDDGASPTVAVKNESCPGASDGFIEFELPCVNSSIEPRYTWNGPEVFNRTGSRLENIAAGEYIVTIKCGKCTRQREIVVGVQPSITITPVQVGELDCKQNFNAFITTSVTGGSGNYNYVWSDGFKILNTSSSSLSHLVAGDYSFNVTDQVNAKCAATKNFSIALPDEGCPCEGNIKLSINGDVPKCSGQRDGHLTAVHSGGVGPYTYEWSTTATTKDIDNVGPGWYTVKVTDSQGSSCFGRAFVPPPPEFSINIVPSNGKTKVCELANEQIELRAVVNASATFVWSDGSTNKSLWIDTPGTYTVTGTSANGCKKDAVITIEKNEGDNDKDCDCKTNVSLQPVDASCNGYSDGSVLSTVSGGSGDYQYTWKNTGSVDKDLVNVPAGSYSLSVTDVKEACVFPLKTAVVNQPNRLEVTITGNLVVCENNTVLNATGSTGSYRWIGRTETTASINVTQPGTYQVEVRNGLCSALSQPVQVQKQPDDVSIFGGQEKLCPGDSILLTSDYLTNNTWSTGEKTRSILVYQPGTYTVSVKLGSCEGSSGSFVIKQADATYCEKPGLCEPQFATPIDVMDQCKQFAWDLARYNAQTKYTHYLEDQKQNFRKGYIAQCLKAQENFTLGYKEKEYLYTLYYYDQSGNLTRTVPPQGVKIIEDVTKLQQIKNDRLANTRTVETEHDYLTTYTYNSYNVLLANKLPDQGTQADDKVSNRNWYDEIGRIVLSQTAYQYQQNPPRYSYSLYDPLNRIVEGGEVRSNTDINLLVNTENATQIFTNKLTAWLNTETKYEVSHTYFDQVKFGIPGFTQDNLRNRIASVTYEAADTDNDSTTYDYGTHYSYDIHGHAKKIVQDNPSLSHLPGQRFKTIDYVYDLISQNVLELRYQKGNPDQFFHRNVYDADNRLAEVWTSSDYIHWDRDVKQFYYQHGPLARTELGHEKVQGLDYAYTIQGWIKGVNSNTLTPNRDIGKDGSNNSLNKFIPPDEMGYSLGYFADDYKAIGTMSATDNFLISQQGGQLQEVNKNLFNGNISNMVTSIKQFMREGEGPLAQSFTYDQLHRLKTSKNYQDKSTITNNAWSPAGTATDKYLMKLTYDDNGNIMTLKRNAHTSTTAEGDGLDDLVYYYENKANGYDKNTNKLISVQDKRNHTGDKELDKVNDIRPGQQKE